MPKQLFRFSIFLLFWGGWEIFHKSGNSGSLQFLLEQYTLPFTCSHSKIPFFPSSSKILTEISGMASDYTSAFQGQGRENSGSYGAHGIWKSISSVIIFNLESHKERPTVLIIQMTESKDWQYFHRWQRWMHKGYIKSHDFQERGLGFMSIKRRHWFKNITLGRSGFHITFQPKCLARIKHTLNVLWWNRIS